VKINGVTVRDAELPSLYRRLHNLNALPDYAAYRALLTEDEVVQLRKAENLLARWLDLVVAAG
jgi:hypothetical protein